MDIAELKKTIRKELPVLIREDPSLREYVLNLTGQMYAGKQYTEDRFWEVLSEMKRDREEQSRKWAEAKTESERKWEQHNRKWEENQKVINQKLADIKKLLDNHDSSISCQWGPDKEQSFRNDLKAVLEELFGVKVLSVTEYDHAGEVYGRPDQVELEMIMFNQTLILCELKSSISKAEVHFFDRKATYYEKHHNRKVTRRIVISPMVDPAAMELAKKLGIEVYSHSYDVPTR